VRDFTDTGPGHDDTPVFRSIPHPCGQKLKLNGIAKHIHVFFDKGLLKDLYKRFLFQTLK
jgi:hypothetical protein